MIDRCTNPNAENYRWYGALGIRVCDRWKRSFDAFVADVGERPPGTTLDRYPNKYGDYEPGNVRWATKVEQGNNARNNLVFAIGNRELTLKQWAGEYAVDYHSLYRQVVTNHRSVEDAVARLRAGVRPGTPDHPERHRIEAMVRDGASVAAICTATGASNTVVYRVRRALGIRRQPSPG